MDGLVGARERDVLSAIVGRVYSDWGWEMTRYQGNIEFPAIKRTKYIYGGSIRKKIVQLKNYNRKILRKFSINNCQIYSDPKLLFNCTDILYYRQESFYAGFFKAGYGITPFESACTLELCADVAVELVVEASMFRG